MSKSDDDDNRVTAHERTAGGGCDHTDCADGHGHGAFLPARQAASDDNAGSQRKLRRGPLLLHPYRIPPEHTPWNWKHDSVRYSTIAIIVVLSALALLLPCGAAVRLPLQKQPWSRRT